MSFQSKFECRPIKKQYFGIVIDFYAMKCWEKKAFKVQILWEDHKIQENPLLFFENYLVMTKQSVRYFQIYVAFSEYLNFNSYKSLVIKGFLRE